MKTFAKFTTAAAMAGALALSMATPSFADSYHHQNWSQGDRGTAAAIGFGAGAAAGAAAAGAYDNGYADQSYAYAEPADGYVEQSYGYATPGYDSYAYAPRAAARGSMMNEGQCMMSPGSQGYQSCNTH